MTLRFGSDPDVGRWVARKLLRNTPASQLAAPIHAKSGRVVMVLSAAALAASFVSPVVALGLATVATGAALRERRGVMRGIGAYDGTAPVGGLRMRVDTDRRVAVVAGVWVEPEHRGQGVAGSLLACALSELKQLGPGAEVRFYAPTHPASKALCAKLPAPLVVGSADYEAARERLAA